MATAQIQHTLGQHLRALAPSCRSAPRFAFIQSHTQSNLTSRNLLFRHYTTPSSSTKPSATSKPTAPFVNPASAPSKSASAINQSQYSPQFKAQTAELPPIKNRTPFFILLGIVGVAFWAGSIAVAANHQRQGTSIVRGTLFNVKFDTKAQELLGENIDFVNPKWPWISGTVAHLKGRVDIEFQVRGSKAEGRVHFVAVRPAKQWVTTDFTLTMPDGTCVVLGENTVLPEL
ncbi:hypothetical protein BGZ51_003261 [Haplosporangium sp. Z 767]|nr:hypothetical protein BGZ51_003261 [Haplosporangium sp. Z 767]KAF9195793.1 hypothetical protein BGZ50_003504 [Haplosporangium sp. Z 11]